MAEEKTIMEETEETAACAAEDTVEETAEAAEAEETAAETGEAAEAEEKEETEEASSEEEKEAAPEKGESLFGKLKGKSKKQEEEIANLTDRLKRTMAEFENFRKRTEREKSQMYEIGASDVIGKILPVLDNFERGLAAIPEDKKEDPVISGMELIYKQLNTVLTDLGVTPIEAVGQPFDPNFHNAVMHIEDEAFGENVVAEEFQKGYKYRDTIIRHSMVKVAN